MENKPLNEVLSGIADRYGTSILLTGKVEEKGKQLVSAKFLNVPLDDAVEALADSVGLKVVRKPNLLYLVEKTSEAPKACAVEPKLFPR